VKLDSAKCVTCGAKAPDVETAHTLITKHGWRLTRDTGGGSVALTWYCGPCWRRRKAAADAGVSSESIALEAGRSFDRARQALRGKS
jgi:hypothetical protein